VVTGLLHQTDGWADPSASQGGMGLARHLTSSD